MKKALRYSIATIAILCTALFILGYLYEQREIIQVKNDLIGFTAEALRLNFSPEWKEIIEEDKYPNLDYANLEFASILKKNLPNETPCIVYRDSVRTYEAYIDGHIDSHKNKP